VNITDGGVLQANLIKGWTDSSSAKLIIDGGTLKARENDTPFSTYCSGLNIYAGDDGAVFDSNGRNITIDKKIEDKSGEAGKVRFSGGGSIALSGANTYTGGTTIELGTKVVAMTDAAKAAAIDNGLVVDGTGLATAGDYTVFEYSGGTLTDADLANVSFRKCGLSTTKEIVGGNSVVIHFEPFAWELNADRTWSELAATYGTPAADEVLQITVTDSDAVLTVDQDATVSQLVFTSGSATTLLVNEDKTLTADNITGIGKITNNGTIVKTGAESISLPFDNASTGMTVINAGQVNVKSVTGSGSAQTIVVKSGATFDMNGYAVTTASVRLEDGATLKDDRKNIRNDVHQTTNLILDGDATVNAVKFFGLCGSSDSAATTLNIGEHTLMVDGSGFWLVNTTIEGGGEIVANGVLAVPKGSSSGADCTLTIASGGTLHGNGTLSVKNFTNNGTINNTAMLTVTGTLTPANEIPRLTLDDGSTVKVTGLDAPQTVTTAFSATGTVTIDATAISADEWLSVETVPVLTAPSKPVGVKWDIVTAPGAPKRRAYWVTEGETSTMYLGKHVAMRVILR
jgi:autotransporter-associated beta strand protein